MWGQAESNEKSIMLEKFNKYLSEDFLDISNSKIFLAISGGVDSMILSHLLNHNGIIHVLLHCNFKLRGNESDEDEKFLRKYAKENNLELIVKSFNTIAISEELNKTIQETARDLRYNWFNDVLDNKDNKVLMTAHHLDDSIETFFINILRGTGIKGIKGIQKHRDYIYRPLLNFTSEDIYAFAEVNDIAYREDSSNNDSKYLRNKLRIDIIPELKSIQPNLKSKMKVLFDELDEIDNWITNQAEEFKKTNFTYSQSNIQVPVEVLINESAPLLKYAFMEYGIHRNRFNEFSKFLSGSTGSIFLADNYKFLIDRGILVINEDSENVHDPEIVLIYSPNATVKFNDNLIYFELIKGNIIDKKKSPLYIDINKIAFPLKLSSWKQGDRISPLGMTGTKLLSDIFIDKKYSLFKKENLIVLSDKKKIIAVLGVTVSELVKVDNKTIEMLEINFT